MSTEFPNKVFFKYFYGEVKKKRFKNFNLKIERKFGAYAVDSFYPSD